MTSSPGRPQGVAALVDDAAGQLARRVARRSVAWWRTGTPAGRTRAAAVHELVGALAAYDAAVEPGTGPGSRRPAMPPREDVLVDQLAVVRYDLVRALAAAGQAAADGPASEAAAQCLLTAYEVDPRPLPAALVDAVLTSGAGAFRGAVERLPRAGDG